MAIYDLYGSLSSDINEAKELLEAALNIQFVAHDSIYHGEYFSWDDKNTNEIFMLKENRDPIDEEPVEMSFQQYLLLFYVDNTLRSLSIKELISEKVKIFVLLMHNITE